jgi:hypothetical protein
VKPPCAWTLKFLFIRFSGKSEVVRDGCRLW